MSIFDEDYLLIEQASRIIASFEEELGRRCFLLTDEDSEVVIVTTGNDLVPSELPGIASRILQTEVDAVFTLRARAYEPGLFPISQNLDFWYSMTADELRHYARDFPQNKIVEIIITERDWV